MNVCMVCGISEVKAGQAVCKSCNDEYVALFGEHWKQTEWGQIVNQVLPIEKIEQQQDRLRPDEISDAVAHRYGEQFVDIPQYRQMIQLDAATGWPVYRKPKKSKYDTRIQMLCAKYPTFGYRKIFGLLNVSDVSLSTVKRRVTELRKRNGVKVHTI